MGVPQSSSILMATINHPFLGIPHDLGNLHLPPRTSFGLVPSGKPTWLLKIAMSRSLVDLPIKKFTNSDFPQVMLVYQATPPPSRWASPASSAASRSGSFAKQEEMAPCRGRLERAMVS